MLNISLVSSEDLTPIQVDELYALAERTGFRYDRGTFEREHFVHRPTMVMAYRDDVLLGFQTYNTYQMHTPFFTGKVPFIYGGLAFHDHALAGRGFSFRLSRFYIRQTLGWLYFLRRYAFLIPTPTPRLMQILSVQHQLIHFKNGLLTPEIVQFAQQFIRSVRRMNVPVSDQLIVQGRKTHTNITGEWATLFRANECQYNDLAIEGGLVVNEEDNYYLTGKYLLLLGHSSTQQLLKSSFNRLTNR